MGYRYKKEMSPHLAGRLATDQLALGAIWAILTYRKKAMQIWDDDEALAARMLNCTPTCAFFDPPFRHFRYCGRSKICPNCRYRLALHVMEQDRLFRGWGKKQGITYRRMIRFDHIHQFPGVKEQLDAGRQRLGRKLDEYVAFQNLMIQRWGKAWNYAYTCLLYSPKYTDVPEKWKLWRQPFHLTVVQGLRYPADNLLVGPLILQTLQEHGFKQYITSCR